MHLYMPGDDHRLRKYIYNVGVLILSPVYVISLVHVSHISLAYIHDLCRFSTSAKARANRHFPCFSFETHAANRLAGLNFNRK